jgi:hypothetical protein
MDQPTIWQDIDDAVRSAINERLHVRNQQALIARSDALLANLPQMGNTKTTTSGLLRRYHMQLRQELCQGNRPRMQFTQLEDELRELTRAIVATIVSDSGISIENAVLLALVLRAQGIVRFCAMPAPPDASG